MNYKELLESSANVSVTVKLDDLKTVPPKETKVYVTREDGPAEGLPNETLTYKAVAYSSSPTDTDRQNVKWQIKVGDIGALSMTRWSISRERRRRTGR